MPKPSTPRQKRGKPTDAPHAERGKRGITEMQKRFCEHVAQGHSHPEAMRRAGSQANERGLEVQASRWLNLPKVQEYLKSIPAVAQAEAAQEEEREARIASAIERQEFWTSVMRGQGEATFVTKEGLLTGPPDWGSRIRAAEALAKAQGDFKDDDGRKVQPQVVINLPRRAMTPAEIEEARRANGNA